MTGSVDGAGECASREDRLRAARAVLADAAHHDDDAIRAACDTVVSLSEDPAERRDARGLRRIMTPGRARWV